jgi:type IV pilus assembly protein PilE
MSMIALPVANMRKSRGFTLIELMIVVLVIAVIVAIAYPSYVEYVRKSRRAQAKADLVELTQRAERFHTVNNTYAGFWATIPDEEKISPRNTERPFYNLARDGDDADAFTLTATPVDGTDQTNDRCGELGINSVGAKTPTEPAECW